MRRGTPRAQHVCCGPTCRQLHRRRPHAARCPLQRARVRDGPLAEVRRGAHQVDVLAQPRVELHSEFHRDGGHRRSAGGSRGVSAPCDGGAGSYTARAGALGRKTGPVPGIQHWRPRQFLEPASRLRPNHQQRPRDTLFGDAPSSQIVVLRRQKTLIQRLQVPANQPCIPQRRLHHRAACDGPL